MAEALLEPGKLARQATYAFATAVGAAAVARRSARRSLLIVCYHGVTCDASVEMSSWLLVHLRDFERQVRYLAAHYRVLALDTALDEMSRSDSAKPIACITFDDGYRNNCTVALPVLRDFALPATVYLATGLVGTDRRLWTTQLQLAVARSTRAYVDLEALGMGRSSLGVAAERRRLGMQLVDQLKRLRVSDRDTVLERLMPAFGVVDLNDGGAFGMMSWDEARAMSDTGLVTFGAHTVNHEILATLDDGAVEREVVDSVGALRGRGLGISETFAYPNGTPADYDVRAKVALRAVGCRAAVTTIEGLNDRHTDPFELQRISVGQDMRFSDFRVRTSGLLPTVKRLLRRRS